MEAEDSHLVEDKLQKREDGTFETAREAKKTNDKKVDRIYKYFHSQSRIELTEEEMVIMNRWEKSWLLLCRYRSRNEVAKLIARICGVSRATAYDDIRNAMQLFSDPRENVKDQKRTILGENLLQGAARAWKCGDLKVHKEYLKEYAEINGLKEETGTESAIAELLKNFKPQQIIFNFKREDLLAETEEIRKHLENTINVDHAEG